MSQPVAVRIDIVSDIICPWCYIGLRRLEAALETLSGIVEAELHWHPFQLDPTLPPEGRDRTQYLEAKFGGPEGARRAYAHVADAGAGEGIAFDFQAITLTPNTLPGHRLLAWAGSSGPAAQTELARVFFRSYFEQGRNFVDENVLLDAVEMAGLDREAAKNALDDKALRLLVDHELSMAKRAGISGVPYFVINNAYAVSGAQPPDVMADVLRQISGQTLN